MTVAGRLLDVNVDVAHHDRLAEQTRIFDDRAPAFEARGLNHGKTATNQSYLLRPRHKTEQTNLIA